ncbi:MAG: GNAT family N-acetyltransferase, partial [Burkholderiales bacterium]
MNTTEKSNNEGQPKLVVRNAQLEDIPAIRALCEQVYPDSPPYSEAQLRGHLLKFPAGQFVAEYEGRVVGYCATFRISEHIAFQPHDWWQITGGGFASRHEGDGDWLYGMEVFVDPKMRGHRIGQRLYNERKALCTRLGLKGIVFGGRLPGLSRRWKKVGSAQHYVDMVKEKKISDRVLSFQLRNGFEVIGVLPGYLP